MTVPSPATLYQKAARFASLWQSFGLAEAARFVLLRRVERLHHATQRAGANLRVLPAILTHPLYMRRQTSDAKVYGQIFVEREYACLDDLEDVGLVLDCGANVGYSSAYFLTLFPNARVVAVEPDAGNFAMLQRNTAPYGERAQCLQAGIWPMVADLRIVVPDDSSEMNKEWAFQVRPCREGEAPDVCGVDVGTLLRQSGAERVSILKMDIEGAEALVFADGYQAWLDRVDTIAIELHDLTTFGDATPPFFAAIAGQGFEVSQSGELTICRRR